MRAGRLRALAISSAERVPSLPGLPTIAESGVPAFEYHAWTAIAAPAGTPRAVLSKWQNGVARALSPPESREYLAAQGAEGGGGPPQAFAAFIPDEHAKWATVVREAGIKAE